MLPYLLDLFFPRSYIDTNVESVRSDIVVEHESSLRARRIDSLDVLTSLVDYRSSLPLQRAMYTLKYQRNSSLVKQLGLLLLDVAIIRYDERFTLVPVPLHWQRTMHRGFNQAELLTNYVHEKLELPMQHVLKRTRDTGHQAWRSREERLAAMHDAFAVRSQKNVPRHIVLIDDIATTGATLNACAKVLKKAGAEYVEGWVIARS